MAGLEDRFVFWKLIFSQLKIIIRIFITDFSHYEYVENVQRVQSVLSDYHDDDNDDVNRYK